nr:MAG TPA: hypothetical protein [Caudoviricetes sp.]
MLRNCNAFLHKESFTPKAKVTNCRGRKRVPTESSAAARDDAKRAKGTKRIVITKVAIPTIRNPNRKQNRRTKPSRVH